MALRSCWSFEASFIVRSVCLTSELLGNLCLICWLRQTSRWPLITFLRSSAHCKHSAGFAFLKLWRFGPVHKLITLFCHNYSLCPQVNFSRHFLFVLQVQPRLLKRAILLYFEVRLLKVPRQGFDFECQSRTIYSSCLTKVITHCIMWLECQWCDDRRFLSTLKEWMYLCLPISLISMMNIS